MPTLTLFYDGHCPLCVKEMNKLKGYDTHSQLLLVDTHSPMFDDYPNIDAQKAAKILHAVDDKGTLILGLDAIHCAWKLVGKGWLYAPLRWPLIKPIADWAYIKFANNRYQISKLLTGKAKCDSGQCFR
ncbi:DUF393 domain-containing protein [Vibrio europaeus]|uniref:DUF393 domain-containing protein n=1 Tax=Vibrio europaeus TaxID=300876 RepID=A0A178J7A9_9VIBR|nr:DUF393 domain-containing protein [Vibrio europaeus]MDC5705814.1 DUF393 domain-containing protein [Vibrio europaeus]MDC5709224.1 DUF393 domain-containing protein [Vibrio europaeus]MDC5713623.1 DUF393 domain-containing protein [Vibrio europaeus]MDC5720343.1 DUF393 domain-containing protein [Vibrio europaeus]MDC5723770.1 DUF393 domain-containing protein [Vibrio europaeus]